MTFHRTTQRNKKTSHFLFLFLTDLFILGKTRVTQRIFFWDAFPTLTTGAIPCLFKPDHDLTMLRNPLGHEFISMNPLFRISIPARSKESCNSL